MVAMTTETITEMTLRMTYPCKECGTTGGCRERRHCLPIRSHGMCSRCSQRVRRQANPTYGKPSAKPSSPTTPKRDPEVRFSEDELRSLCLAEQQLRHPGPKPTLQVSAVKQYRSAWRSIQEIRTAGAEALRARRLGGMTMAERRQAERIAS